jgi:hypothetical protein
MYLRVAWEKGREEGQPKVFMVGVGVSKMLSRRARLLLCRAFAVGGEEGQGRSYGLLRVILK